MTPQEQEREDRKRRAAVEMANSYREIMQTVAWRDLDGEFEKLVKDSNKDLDVMPVEHLSATVAAHGRGVRYAVDMIRKHIGYRTSEGPK